MKLRFYVFSFIIFLLVHSFALALQDKPPLQHITAAMHLHSTWSYGDSDPLEKFIQEARDLKIDVVIPTDRALARWEYGLWPFRKLIRKTIEYPSILQMTPEKYLEEIKILQKKYPDILILPGVEAAPGYYWTGSPFSEKLTLHDWHKHLLIVGLENPETYRRLPLISNPKAGEFDIFSLWPGLLIVLGIPLIMRKLWLGIIIIFLGAAGLAAYFPYRDLPYDSYHGDLKFSDAQNVINYVNENDGLAFWSHPEAFNWEKPVKLQKNVFAQTIPYDDVILKTHDYTGFAILWEGFKRIGKPGGDWDQALMEYSRGQRRKPVWAVGEIDYRGDKLSKFSLDALNMGLFVQNKSKEAVIEAFRAGRVYISRASASGNNPILHDMVLTSGKKSARMGELLIATHNPRLTIKLSTENDPIKGKLSLIRGGDIIQEFELTTPATIRWEDPNPVKEGKTFYRAVVKFKNAEVLITNPIFYLRGDGPL